MGLKEEIEALKASIALKEELLKLQQSQQESEARNALNVLRSRVGYKWSVHHGEYGSFEDRRPGICLKGEVDDASCVLIQEYAAKFPEFWAKLKPYDQYSGGGDVRPPLTKNSTFYFGDRVAPNCVVVTADGGGWQPIKMRKGRYQVLTDEQWSLLETRGVIPTL